MFQDCSSSSSRWVKWFTLNKIIQIHFRVLNVGKRLQWKAWNNHVGVNSVIKEVRRGSSKHSSCFTWSWSVYQPETIEAHVLYTLLSPLINIFVGENKRKLTLDGTENNCIQSHASTAFLLLCSQQRARLSGASFLHLPAFFMWLYFIIWNPCISW